MAFWHNSQRSFDCLFQFGVLFGLDVTRDLFGGTGLRGMHVVWRQRTKHSLAFYHMVGSLQRTRGRAERASRASCEVFVFDFLKGWGAIVAPGIAEESLLPSGRAGTESKRRALLVWGSWPVVIPTGASPAEIMPGEIGR